MKILIKLYSTFYTEEQNSLCHETAIEVDWGLSVLPRKGESLDCESIIGDNMPQFDPGLTWSVDDVVYEKHEDMITPIIFLLGE